MPLILVTGLPSSGKSAKSELIAKYLKTKLSQASIERPVKIVTDSDLLDWDGRDVIYSSIAKEKELRGWLKAEVHRHVNLNEIVILDAAAYIKGFRYELFCICKEAETQYCVVELFMDPKVCSEWNQSRTEPGYFYSKEVLDALVFRYEKCDVSNRWESPLFSLTKDEDNLDMDQIYEIVMQKDPLVPNKCTSISTSTTTIFKHRR